MELYKTIKKEASETQIIEKSRFIANAKPVETRKEAEDFIAQIKGQYKDATHNVPAMVIGTGSQIQWASDDGEPQGTSGAPIVQMMVSEGLTNLVVVVTRYFGGTKLGTGGLVRAYTGSAKLAVEAAGICSVIKASRITVQIDYTYLSKIQQLSQQNLQQLSQQNAQQLSQQNARQLSQPGAGNTGSAGFALGDINYGEKVCVEILTPFENEEAVLNLLANITSGSAEIIDRVYGPEKL